MKNKNNMIFVIFIMIAFLPTISCGMMAVGDTGTTVSEESSAVPSQQKTIFLLAWDDNFLQTSKGTLSTIGVKIVDHADIDRKKLPRLKKLPIVKFTTKDNQITQVDIYPPR